jgi:ABC-type nitrate/sulfonate/bicarbonate transport system permease component
MSYLAEIVLAIIGISIAVFLGLCAAAWMTAADKTRAMMEDWNEHLREWEENES